MCESGRGKSREDPKRWEGDAREGYSMRNRQHSEEIILVTSPTLETKNELSSGEGIHSIAQTRIVHQRVRPCEEHIRNPLLE